MAGQISEDKQRISLSVDKEWWTSVKNWANENGMSATSLMVYATRKFIEQSELQRKGILDTSESALQNATALMYHLQAKALKLAEAQKKALEEKESK